MLAIKFNSKYLLALIGFNADALKVQKIKDTEGYYSVLSEEMQKLLIEEEQEARKKFGIYKLPDKTISKLQDLFIEKQENELIGAMSYSILDNPAYQKKFQYI